MKKDVQPELIFKIVLGLILVAVIVSFAFYINNSVDKVLDYLQVKQDVSSVKRLFTSSTLN